MRLKFAAWGIVIVAALDLFLVLAALQMGWIDWPRWDEAPLASVLMPLSILLLIIATIGALPIIIARGGTAFGFEMSCYECGSERPHDLSFCVRCGAAA